MTQHRDDREPIDPDSALGKALARGRAADAAGNVMPLPAAPPEDGGPARPRGRRVRFVPAPTTMRPVQWLLTQKMPLEALTLLGGREGIGKSTVAYTWAADITRGTLPGRYFGQPRGVVVCATEDSWEQTITPRLVGAGADMTRVYRTEVETAEGFDGTLTLPVDLDAMEREAKATGTVLVLFDPLLSRLDAALDTHKDADVRRALEPLTKFAERAGLSVLGLIHVNKATTSDPVNSLMGSRAFGAVARTVLYVVADHDDPGGRLLGVPKNNLGKANGPSLRFRIESHHVAEHPDGPISTGVVRWNGEDSRTVGDVMADSAAGPESRTVRDDCADWLRNYLVNNGGSALSDDVKAAARAQRFSDNALRAARTKANVEAVNLRVAPRRTQWRLPETQLDDDGDQS